MVNFADQCLDIAQSILGHNLNAINEDGSIDPVDSEVTRIDEPGHAALAIGEYHRLTQQTEFEGHDLIDLAARCVTIQVFSNRENENGLAYAALALLSFGPAKKRNPVWERLLDPTRERLDQRLLVRSDSTNHYQAFNIAKAVTRYSMGLSKKDETSKLIDKFIERIQQNSSGNYFDDVSGKGIGGVFDIYGMMAFSFIRQALQLSANINLRDRLLPSLRTYVEKYIKMMPDLVRQDGLGWCYGQGIGAYGQIHCISIIMQAMRDGWISEEQTPFYTDILRRLFQFYFMTYLDQEHGFLVIRDEERSSIDRHTTRMANFDGARTLCQWARLARSIGGTMESKHVLNKRGGRFINYDKKNRKEQGLFLYHDPECGLHIHLPLVGSAANGKSDSLSFPHCPGIFDWPVDRYLPIMLPELRFGDKIIIPAFYGRRCTTGLGLKNSFYFRYEQPDLITVDEEIVPGLGSCKVAWEFCGNKITSEFIFTVKSQVQLSTLRYVLAIASPHSNYKNGTTLTLGAQGLRCNVVRDDFQAVWRETETVTNESDYKTYYGNINYLQTLIRDHPLNMRPKQEYRLKVTFEPDIALAGE